jgi:hypothetical protein
MVHIKIEPLAAKINQRKVAFLISKTSMMPVVCARFFKRK